MTEDNKQPSVVTEAGAVELQETSLDEAAGGGAGDAVAWKLDPVGQKVNPVGNKFDPIGWKLDPGAIGNKF